MLNRNLIFKMTIGDRDDRYKVTLEDEQQHIISELSSTAASKAAIISLFESFATTFYSNVVEPYKKEQEGEE